MKEVNFFILGLFVGILTTCGYFIFKDRKCCKYNFNKLNIFGKKLEIEKNNYKNWDGSNDGTDEEKFFTL
tara:strand:- start:3690 stop:3899 length:210 start_codon:yes stop_codon:yes gene_type:complete